MFENKICSAAFSIYYACCRRDERSVLRSRQPAIVNAIATNATAPNATLSATAADE